MMNVVMNLFNIWMNQLFVSAFRMEAVSDMASSKPTNKRYTGEPRMDKETVMNIPGKKMIAHI